MAQIRNFAFDITAATTTDFLLTLNKKVMKAVKRRSLAESQKLQFFFMILKYLEMAISLIR